MEPILSTGTDATGGKGPLVKDTDTANFVQDVIEGSKDRPVLVDFWAEWCGPCKQLTPTLEKLMGEYGGKVALIKVNIDQNQQIAAQLRVQSIPTVFAFYQGQPVDAFQGALPESQLRSFIDKVLASAGDAGSGLDDMIEHGFKLLDDGKTQDALQIFAQASQMDGENPKILGGMAQAFIALEHLDEAKELLEQIPEEKAKDPAITKARAALELADLRENAGDLTQLEQKLAANNDDHQTRYDLAIALTSHGRNDDAAKHLLEIIAKERDWNDGAAKDQLLKMFDAAGMTDPFTLKWRRRLSSLLFS